MPLAIDLFCGLGGWAEGFLAEDWDVIGFDIERHDYGTGGYPGQLVLQDVLTLHGSQFKDATCIVSSPPCQAYSYRAMPWKKAKALPPPDNTLFEACFRIQREACEAAGHHIPLIVENVRGAQKWVGRAAWHYGSYYLWGDVPALMPQTLSGTKHDGSGWTENGSMVGQKRMVAYKVPGIKLSEVGFNVAAAQRYREGRKLGPSPGKRWEERPPSSAAHREGVKFSQSGDAWFDGKPRDKMVGSKGPSAYGSHSDSRKAASAMIAKIPFPLAVYISRCFKPQIR